MSDDSTSTCQGSSKNASLGKQSEEILLKIFSYLSYDDLVNLKLVNRKFNRISKDEALLKKVCFFNFVLITINLNLLVASDSDYKVMNSKILNISYIFFNF